MKTYEICITPVALEALSPRDAAVRVLQQIAQGKVAVAHVAATCSPADLKAIQDKTPPGMVRVFVRERGRALLRRKTGKGSAPILTWWPMGASAQIMCLSGHSVILLPENHTIRDNGEVFPSVVCGFEDCTFHAFVQLDGWEPKT